MIKIAVSGACGKMGLRIIALALQDKDLKVVTGLEQKGHKQVGNAVSGISISDDMEDIKTADVLIEFTSPQATIEHLETAVKYKKSMVIGTTGLTDEQKSKIKEASRKIPIIFSPNMSLGVNLLFQLVRESAEKLSKEYNVNIVEAHHIHKKDAPSGTAKRLAEIVKETTGKEVKDIKSIREGEIIGDHEVIFDSSFDTIRLSHFAKTRDIFAQGALEAAKYLFKKKAGLYSMLDVIG